MPALTQTRNIKLDIKVVTLILGVQEPQGTYSLKEGVLFLLVFYCFDKMSTKEGRFLLSQSSVCLGDLVQSFGPTLLVL